MSRKKRCLSLDSAAWKRLRAQVLAEEPLCRMCTGLGLVEPATDVDHIVDSRDDYSDDNSRDNLQALCHVCHSLKTAGSLGRRVYLGCGIDGLPVDPNHPWNREKITSNQTGPERRGEPFFFANCTIRNSP